jgi:hypothetical protein
LLVTDVCKGAGSCCRDVLITLSVNEREQGAELLRVRGPASLIERGEEFCLDLGVHCGEAGMGGCADGNHLVVNGVWLVSCTCE